MAATLQPELIPATDPNWKPANNSLAVITPMALIQRAIDNKYDMTQLKDLFEMAKEWRRLDAEQAFNADFSEFAKDKPEIIKNKTGKMQGQSKSSGRDYAFEYSYADLFEVCNKVSDKLAAYGIVHTYESETKLIPVKDSFMERIKVTCILKHKSGHTYRGATLEGPPDKSGAKNEIQATLSGSSYLERKTLLMTTGCAPKDIDQDGQQKPEGGELDHVEAREEEILRAADKRALMAIFKTHHEAAGQSQDAIAMLRFNNAKDKRKEELEREEKSSS